MVEFARLDSTVKFAPAKSGAPEKDDGEPVIREKEDCPEKSLVAEVVQLGMQSVSEDLLK